jgi:uncharacterized protein
VYGRLTRPPRRSTEVVIPTTDEDRVHQVLPEDECRRLLGKGTIGRLAYTSGALPVLLPVSYRVHDGHVVVAARRRDDVVDAVRGSVVAFGVDSWDERRTGWAVTVVGPARLAICGEQVRELDELHTCDRPRSPERCYILVQTRLVQGRRLVEPFDTAPSRDGRT